MKVVIRVDDDLTLGKVVLVARQSHGWSRRKLAEASGKCESTIINVERRTTVRDERSALELIRTD